MLQFSSLGFVALTLADRPPDFNGASRKVDAVIESPQARHHFQAKLREEQAYVELDANRPRLAIKLARQAISHAEKSDSPAMVFSTRYREAQLVLLAGDYRLAARKLQGIWKIMEATDPARVHENNHEMRAVVLKMRKRAHAELGELNSVKSIQDLMFELGYAAEDGDSYIARVSGQ